MTFSVAALFGIAFIYLSILFGIAYASERNWIPERFVKHPAIYVLSLGVYAGAWAFFGVIDLAYQYGYGFLSYYIGASALFLFAPLILEPLLRISRAYQLNSLADILAFRYRSRAAGSIVTIFLLIAVMPLLALQIQAVSEAVHYLSNDDFDMLSEEAPQEGLAFIFCITIMAFTLLFGARYSTEQKRHNGLVLAIAFETLIKCILLLILGMASVTYVFDDFMGLQRWLEQNQQYVGMLHTRMQDSSFRTLLLVFFASSLILPQMFHMTFTEKPSRNSIRVASWGAPLLFLFLSLPILPILWAGLELGAGISPQYYLLTLGISLNQAWLTVIAFVLSLAAVSGTMIVITLSLASMCLNHLVLAYYQPNIDSDIYRWLMWIRRILIVAIIVAGYSSYQALHHHENLAGLGFAGFTATLQFLPGLLAVLYWPKANRIGFLAGLCSGFLIWFFVLLLPTLTQSPLDYMPIVTAMLPAQGGNYWSFTTILSISVNITVFVGVSMLTPRSPEEKTAAELCSQDDLNRPVRRALSVASVPDMIARLSDALGPKTSEREVLKALKDLRLHQTETRPYALRRLRDRLEANLSGLLGPSVAHELIDRQVPYMATEEQDEQQDIYLIENKLDNFKTNLTGVASQLDDLRRYHRETLEKLPIGVCALSKDQELMMWNQSMETLTGIDSDHIIGTHIERIPAPWGGILSRFSEAAENHQHKAKFSLNERERWISLHKAESDSTSKFIHSQLIVVEDLTETQLLEQELMHNERLASIGRLAAGVAHEIGNPITGIDCLAQNLKYDSHEPVVHETAAEILSQTKRVSRIVQSLVSFSHSGQNKDNFSFGPVNVHECVQAAINLLALNKDYKGVEMYNHCDTDALIEGDNQQLQQVFINLLSNAKDACEKEGIVSISTEVHDHEILIHITDDGTGIPAAIQDTIFEPFVTTKIAGEGTGLGLSLVYSIIEDHKGQISIESPVDTANSRGTKFTLRLRKALKSIV